MLTDAGVRVTLDDRDSYTPGWKYAEWEMKGVPLRLEIGPKDIEKSQVVLVRRDTREKLSTPITELAERVKDLLLLIQKEMLARAKKFRDDHTNKVTSRKDFIELLGSGRPGFVIAPWCGQDECEAKIKKETQATIRNIPLEERPASGPCVQCGSDGKTDAYFAKSY
jgi:prolyl-tRNA synthetase